VDDAPATYDARPDAPRPDVPIVDVGPLPDGFEWARCEDYVAAGSPPDGACDPATFGECRDPSDVCGGNVMCDPDLRRVSRLLIC
jgi:hypothetical protein